jgi:hypothetical protein
MQSLKKAGCGFFEVSCWAEIEGDAAMRERVGTKG